MSEETWPLPLVKMTPEELASTADRYIAAHRGQELEGLRRAFVAGWIAAGGQESPEMETEFRRLFPFA